MENAATKYENHLDERHSKYIEKIKKLETVIAQVAHNYIRGK